MKRISLFVLVIYFLLCFFAHAETLYVRPVNDCSGSPCGLADGSDWDNAFNGFSDVSWGAGAGKVSAGDTLYVSGGSSTKTYNEKLIIGTSGTAGNLVTIKIGQDSGYNGTAIIDGTGIGASSDGITFPNPANYITISGQVGSGTGRNIKLQNWDSGCHIYLAHLGGNVIFEYLDIYDAVTQGTDRPSIYIGVDDISTTTGNELRYSKIYGDNRYGIKIAPASGTVVAYGGIKIHHNTIQDFREDAIQSGGGSIDVYNNTIGASSASSAGHPDGVQIYGNYYRIYSNYFYNLTPKTAHDWGATIYWDNNANTTPNHLVVYNNVFYEASPDLSANGAITIGTSDSSITSIEYVYILNNTIVGYTEAFGALNLSLAGGVAGITYSNINILNNILYTNVGWSVETKNSPTWGSFGDGTNIEMDYNIWNSSNNVTWVSSGTYANRKTALGVEDHGVTTDPSLSSIYKFTTGSSAENAGATLKTMVESVDVGLTAIDYDGVPRPQGTAFDIGAYEKIVPRTFTLTVAGTGTCSVSSSPSGINSTTSTTYDFNDNTEVTLTASALSGSTFAGWSGDGGCSGVGTCVLTVDGTNDAATATCNLSGGGATGAMAVGTTGSVGLSASGTGSITIVP